MKKRTNHGASRASWLRRMAGTGPGRRDPDACVLESLENRSLLSGDLPMPSFDPGDELRGVADVIYVENAPPVALEPGIAVSDPDSLHFVLATVSITNNYMQGEDWLTWNQGLVDAFLISADFDESTGVLTISGGAMVPGYGAILQSVSYHNTSEDPSSAIRTMEFMVTDGMNPQFPATTTVEVVPVNDAPVGDPDGEGPGVAGDPGDAPGSPGDPGPGTLPAALTYTENNPPTIVFPSLTVSDVDNDTLMGATFTLIGFNGSEDLLTWNTTLASNLGLTVVLAGGEITVSGEATTGEYQSLLRSIRYANSSEDPSDALRRALVVVNDGGLDSGPIVRDIDVVPVNDAPVVVLTSGFVYTEGDGDVLVDGGLTVSDADDTMLTGATVAITSGYVEGQDVLGFTDQNGISGTFDPSTGVLTLTGSATLQEYRDALRSVTYLNTSETPDTTDRVFRFIVSDGTDDSAPAFKTIGVVDVAPENQPPVLTAFDVYDAEEGRNVEITYDELVAMSDLSDDGLPEGGELSFRLVGVTNGALLRDGVELLIGSLIGPGDVVTYVVPTVETIGLGVIEGFLLVAFDGELASSPDVPVNFNVMEAVDPPEAQPLTPGSSVGMNGTENVAIANTGGEVLLFQDPLKGNDWFFTNLTESQDFPTVLGNVITWVDSKDGLTYAAGVARDGDNGLLVFRQGGDGVWTVRNLSSELGVTNVRGGSLAAVEGPDNLVRISALGENGDLVLFTQTGEQGLTGEFAYGFENLFVDQLDPAGETRPQFTGQMIAYVTTWGAIHIAGVDVEGDIWNVWTSPTLQGVWDSDNVSAIAGTPTLEGALTVLITPWGTMHIAGTNADGELIVTWWAPEFGATWELDNLTSEFGGPDLQGSLVQAYVTSWGGLNYVGITMDGEAMIYWWSAEADTWNIDPMNALAPEAADITLNSVTGISGPFTTISVFGVGQGDGDTERSLFAYLWDGPTDTWTVQNLTETAMNTDTEGPIDLG